MHKTPRRNGIGTSRRKLAALASIGLSAAALLLLPGGCSTTPEAPASDGPVGSADQRVQGCVTIKRGFFGTVADAHLNKGAMTTNDGGGTILIVDATDEALVKFDLGFVPAGAVLSSATMNLYTNGASGTAPINVHRVLAPWSESTVTYASFNQQFSPLVAGIIQPSSTNAQKSLDVTALAASWLSGATPNHGVLLESNSPSWSVFITSEGHPAMNPAKIDPTTLRPELVLCYNNPANFCAPQPCQNGGTCQNGFSGYTCQCAPGYTGTSASSCAMRKPGSRRTVMTRTSPAVTYAARPPGENSAAPRPGSISAPPEEVSLRAAPLHARLRT
jgi:hypothetical protein